MPTRCAGGFDVVLAEALDRISRDQEDVAGVFKRMAFAGVKIITLSEGEITHLHVGLKGTMNALFLKDLADKTRRGLRGRVEAGKAGGGLCYGYDVVKRSDAAGEPMRGERSINEAEAKIVRRIFREFAAGKSPRAIAVDLNREGVPGPFGNAWGDTTIRGHASRGNGILNNELYIGRLVWNRQRFIKDPSTGRRVSRRNPERNGSGPRCRSCASSMTRCGRRSRRGKPSWPSYSKRPPSACAKPVPSGSTWPAVRSFCSPACSRAAAARASTGSS